jgi:TRAP-type transport system periplasmic protein
MTFLKFTRSKLALGLLLASGLMSNAAAQTNMRISISIGQNSHQGIGIDTFAKEVEKRTAGRYKIQPFYSGSLSVSRLKPYNWAHRS